MAPPQHRRPYSMTALHVIENRKEYYDKHGQMICITMSPVSGHKLPLLVKFPRTTSYFRRMSVRSRYRDNSEGLFNGVYYILRKYDSGELPIGNTQSISNYGSSFDLRERVKETQMYRILKTAYTNVHRNVYITSQRKVHMNKEQLLYNFRADPDLKTNGSYLKIVIITKCSSVNQLRINQYKFLRIKYSV